MIKIYKYGEVPNSEIFARENISANVEDIVADIIADVRKTAIRLFLLIQKSLTRPSLRALRSQKKRLTRL